MARVRYSEFQRNIHNYILEQSELNYKWCDFRIANAFLDFEICLGKARA